MKKIIAAAALLAVGAIFQPAWADSNEVVAVTRLADGSSNTWTMADLQAALGLLNRKYHRDVERPAGRAAWHGPLEREIPDAARGVKTEVYADGTRFEFPYRDVGTPTAISNRNSQLKLNLTRGVSANLAAARLRRAQERATTNIVYRVVQP